jgi:hypothetical protein
MQSHARNCVARWRKLTDHPVSSLENERIVVAVCIADIPGGNRTRQGASCALTLDELE